MRFAYTDGLRRYMEASGKKIIIVEVIQCDGDFEVTELHVHFTDERQAKLFQERRKFRRVETELGAVLLPNYRLQYQDTVTFGLKKVLFWHVVTQTGISL